MVKIPIQQNNSHWKATVEAGGIARFSRGRKKTTIVLITLAILGVILGILFILIKDNTIPVQGRLPLLKDKSLVVGQPGSIGSILGDDNVVTIFAYNALPEQTDSSPLITASGQRVREGIVANNCLPFGTKVKIDNKIYEVQDRMNKKYGCGYFDIFFWNYDEAKEWGVRRLEIEIIK